MEMVMPHLLLLRAGTTLPARSRFRRNSADLGEDLNARHPSIGGNGGSRFKKHAIFDQLVVSGKQAPTHRIAKSSRRAGGSALGTVQN
jgi:hypothetical protein